ncbi:MAG TPA: hypothetical protein ENH91_01700 [Leeuwenhoekiella sp.]|nr:hypothetical protein [Leeuwenhoekiella sp.]
MKEYHLVKTGVFGSVVREEQTENSDIDIIVEFEENTLNLYEIKQKLKKELQIHFNQTVDICREKYVKPVFRKQILLKAAYV